VTLQEFYSQVRVRFPDISRKADLDYGRLWGGEPSEGVSLWFESLASALNEQMRRDVPPTVHLPLLLYISSALDGSDEVVRCIDVAFVENLFGWVGPERSPPYWAAMPDCLKQLYLGFHARPPIP